jgi:putative transposase
MTSQEVMPALYSRDGATLLLPSQGITPRPLEGTHICYAGWSYSTSLRTSQPKRLLAVLSTSQLRKRLLKSA